MNELVGVINWSEFDKGIIAKPIEINGHYKIIPDMHLKYQEKYLIVSYQEYNEIRKNIEDKDAISN